MSSPDPAASGRVLGPDCTPRYLDASLNAGDLAVFLAGYGVVSLAGPSGMTLNSDIKFTNEPHMPMEFRELTLNLQGSGGWGKQLVVLEGRAQVEIPHKVLQQWRTMLRRWLTQTGISLDYRVWPLIPQEPPVMFDRQLWSIARENEALALAITRRRSLPDSLYVIVPVSSTLDVEAIHKLHREDASRNRIATYVRTNTP